MFLSQLAVRAGRQPFRWDLVSKKENVDAAIAAYRCDEGPMRAMLGRILP